MYAPAAGAYRGAVQIRYGHITGWCERCGGTEFECVAAAQTPSYCLLRCPACGAVTRYGDIMCQIGDAAVRQSQAALRRLKARYRLALLAERKKKGEGDDAGDVAAPVQNRKGITT
jgi:hypothetical protein